LGAPQFPGQLGLFHNGQTYVLTKNNIYYIQGTGDGTFLPLKMDAKTGAQSIRGAVSVTGKGIYHTGPDGIYRFSGNDVRCADIAFHPQTNVLYGFDGLAGRLVVIDPVTGRVNDQIYPAVGICDVMASLFFDAFGNLYGYGRPVQGEDINTLYSIKRIFRYTMRCVK